MKTLRHFVRALLLAAALFSWGVATPQVNAQAAKKSAAKPAPSLANIKYGAHERNVLDLWQAKAGQPTPLVVYIHGGGFRGGSKESISPALLETLLAQGISVMAINYRLSPEVSFPAH